MGQQQIWKNTDPRLHWHFMFLTNLSPSVFIDLLLTMSQNSHFCSGCFVTHFPLFCHLCFISSTVSVWYAMLSCLLTFCISYQKKIQATVLHHRVLQALSLSSMKVMLCLLAELQLVRVGIPLLIHEFWSTFTVFPVAIIVSVTLSKSAFISKVCSLKRKFTTF